MQRYSILWADDEIDLLKPHILFLETRGYDITPVNNGSDAVEMSADKNFDIIFLDENLKVLHIERNIPAHPGRNEKPPIPKTPIVKCRYVLEIKASAPFGKELNVGDRLLLKSNYSIGKIREFILKNYY